MEAETQTRFLQSLAKARAWLDSHENNGITKTYGIRSKHLSENRIVWVKPIIGQVGDYQAIVGFQFAVVRHPRGLLLKQFWNISLSGYLQMAFEKPMGHKVWNVPHCGRFIHRSELWKDA